MEHGPDLSHLVQALEANSARIADVLAPISHTTPVPTCPEWTAGDLLHHLAAGQHYWSRMLEEGVTTQAEADAVDACVAADSDAVEQVRSATRAVCSALRRRSPEAQVWTWSTRPDDHTVGFVARRLAHEAHVHRIDAELTAAPDGGARTPVDPLLAADGVDEALRVFAAATPPEADVEVEDGRVIRVVASDVGLTWLVTMTRVGVVEDGRPRARQGIYVADHDPADGTVRPAAILTASAEDLMCRFWGRPTSGEPQRAGDLRLLEEFASVLGARVT